MTWLKLSDGFTRQPSMLRLSRSARYLHIEGLEYCNEQLTDGYLPRNALGRVTDDPDPESSVAALVVEGLWQPVGDEGWQLDWSDQERAVAVRRRKKQNAERQAAWRERRDLHKAGDHSKCDPTRCPYLTRYVSRDVTDNETRDETREGTGSPPVTRDVTDDETLDVTRNATPPRPLPTRPDPSRPVPKGQGQGQGQGQGAGGPVPGSAGAPPDPPPQKDKPPGVSDADWYRKRNRGGTCDCESSRGYDPEGECFDCGGDKP
ncbi:hypothetical protein EKO23_15255 [Nocardioides guangzhouensis]|uniref:Uncharacterized protein n=1 Tax=Nocardioides guangzhouensis TaxID=2497878 RepID=A0A4V1XYW0_9ACTN|nr:hypothetical protein [Nocardioides guangzhouensis]RYP84619.1 hypothetical protein EKO23_15255 [Nocardioides guangzhouensis]